MTHYSYPEPLKRDEQFKKLMYLSDKGVQFHRYTHQAKELKRTDYYGMNSIMRAVRNHLYCRDMTIACGLDGNSKTAILKLQDNGRWERFYGGLNAAMITKRYWSIINPASIKVLKALSAKNKPNSTLVKTSPVFGSELTHENKTNKTGCLVS